MSTNGSSKWREFSEYEIRISDDGTKYVCPVPGSAAVFYDPMAKPDKLAIAVTNAAEAYLKDMTDESVVLDLVRSAGLPGFALGLSEDQVFPFGGSPAAKSDLLLAGRGPEYGTVFSGQ